MSSDQNETVVIEKVTISVKETPEATPTNEDINEASVIFSASDEDSTLQKYEELSVVESTNEADEDVKEEIENEIFEVLNPPKNSELCNANTETKFVSDEVKKESFDSHENNQLK